MRWSIVSLLILCLLGCNGATKKQRQVDRLYRDEMLAIDWNDVDIYPMYPNCDETQTKEGQKACFEQEFISNLTKALRDFRFSLPPDVDTTVHVEFVVDNEGKIGMVRIDKNAIVDKYIPEFEGVVARSLKSLPTLRPAVKRGTPVSARFRIPLVLNTRQNN